MSLLMDALKRAEQAKERNSAAPALSLEPLANRPEALPPGKPEQPLTDSSAAPAGAERLPSLPRLEDLDEQFIAIAQQPPPQARGRAAWESGGGQRPVDTAPATGQPQPAQRAPQMKTDARGSSPQQTAIRNAFAVKEPAAKSRGVWLTIAALTLAATAAVGIHFWMQLRPAAGIRVAASPPLASTPARAEIPTALPVVPPVASPAAGTPVAAAELPAASLGARPDGAPRKEPTTGKVSRDDTPPAVAARSSPSVVAAPAEIRLARSVDRTAPPVAAEGYEAFRTGNLAAARIAYERSLRSDPRNVDAMLGLATVALREDRVEDAEAGYLRILEIDPRNAEAHAALVGLRQAGDPVMAESRIKSLLAQQPNMPVLHFALGNLYARQLRWSEAQQAYFKALTADGDNPDYLFNMAVSLDQLHQPRLAGDYYSRALKAAEGRHAAFDRSVAARRLGELAQP